jgi:hypothetical protein
VNSSPCPEFDLGVLKPGDNVAYLSKPIPVPRDGEIFDLLGRVISDHRVARFRGSLDDGHANVLSAFSERMVSRAVRDKDSEILSLGLIALLLTWRETNSHELLPIMGLYSDATVLLGLNPTSLVDSTREILGDVLIEPFVAFLARSEADRSLQAMGYSRAVDESGFRYLRNW